MFSFLSRYRSDEYSACVGRYVISTWEHHQVVTRKWGEPCIFTLSELVKLIHIKLPEACMISRVTFVYSHGTSSKIYRAKLLFEVC